MTKHKAGGIAPIRSEVASAVTAARPFFETRDIPDVLNLQDLESAPEDTYAVLRERLAAECLFVDHHRFPLPKASGQTRSITVLHPMDEMLLRVFVGRVSSAVAATVDRKHVLNGLITSPGPRWVSADFQAQIRKRRELQRAHYESPETEAVGFFDVKDFFPTCQHQILDDLLGKINAPLGAVERLIQLLSALFPRRIGLPIGFEGSGPLANLFLRSVDEELVRAGVEFVRWTDDIDVFLRDERDWPSIAALVHQELAAVALALNPTKTEMLPKGPRAEDRLLDPGRDSLFDDNAEENIADKLAFCLWMREQFDLDEPIPAAHLRSYLGLLRKQRSTGALEFLLGTPEWIDKEPRSVGNYLGTLLGERQTRAEVDVPALLELATRSPDKASAAGQLHLFRALSAAHLDKEAGKRALDLATNYSVMRRFAPLGAWACMAWASSRAWNASEAIDIASSFGDFSYRRAAISSFGAHTPNAATSEKLRAIARRDHELLPVVSLVT